MREPRKQNWFTAQSQGVRIVIGAGALLVVCACCAGIVAVANNGNTRTPGVSAAATATHTPDPVKALNAYKALVVKDTGILSTDAHGLTTGCSSGDSSACSAAIQTFDTDVKAFQQDLKNTPAPACLKAVDTDLRKGLDLYDSGLQTAMSGITQQDAAMIRQGSATIGQGTTFITKASAEIPKASC